MTEKYLLNQSGKQTRQTCPSNATLQTWWSGHIYKNTAVISWGSPKWFNVSPPSTAQTPANLLYSSWCTEVNESQLKLTTDPYLERSWIHLIGVWNILGTTSNMRCDHNCHIWLMLWVEVDCEHCSCYLNTSTYRYTFVYIEHYSSNAN